VVRNVSIGGLMDRQYIGPADELGEIPSILAHLWIPVVIIGTAGTAGMVRRLRANLLDELQKQYVVTARAKGLHPLRALVKYPLRMSLNFFISDIGSILPAIISGAEVTAIVLSLETTGPLLIRACRAQDMYLAGSFLMFLAFLTVIGVLISDIALAMLDPRIRLQRRKHANEDMSPLAERRRQPLRHYRLDGPSTRMTTEDNDGAAEEGRSQASQWKLMWWKFRRHRHGADLRHLPRRLYADDRHQPSSWRPTISHTRNIELHLLRRRRACGCSMRASSSGRSSTAAA
jgi:hypothetical protein